MTLDGFLCAVDASDAFNTAVKHMKIAERKMLALHLRQKDIKTRKHLGKIHKMLIKHRRAYANIQQERGQIVGNLYD